MVNSLSVCSCSTRKLRKSFVGHPDAMLFLRISRERVFQHPRMIGSTELMVTFQRNFPMRHQRTNLGPCVVSTELYCSWCSARLGHPPLACCTSARCKRRSEFGGCGHC